MKKCNEVLTSVITFSCCICIYDFIYNYLNKSTSQFLKLSKM